MTEVIYLPSGADVRFEERTVVIKPHTAPKSFKKTSSKPYHQDNIACHVDELDHWIAIYNNDSWAKIYVVGKDESLSRR
jgi:hypothetical protein